MNKIFRTNTSQNKMGDSSTHGNIFKIISLQGNANFTIVHYYISLQVCIIEEKLAVLVQNDLLKLWLIDPWQRSLEQDFFPQHWRQTPGNAHVRQAPSP